MSAQIKTAIVGGRVPDFWSGTLVPAAVAIDADGRIAAVEAGEEASRRMKESAESVIDATGRIVSPGFIDIHMHEENLAETDDYQIGRLMARMGVTTCVAGNCGQSPQDPSAFAEWVSSKGGAPVNYAVLAGYNSYREAQGLGPYDAAKPEQTARAREAVRREAERGCWGLSFGLEYDPAITYQEMIEAVRAVADLSPFVSIHFRADCEDALASLHEMARLSRETGVAVEVSHLSSLAGYGYMAEALDFIRAEQEANPLFGYDTYPYTAFGTTIGSAVFDVDWRDKWGVGYDAVQFLYPPYQGQRATKQTYTEVHDEHPEQTVVCFAMRQSEIDAAILEPTGYVCSDGGVYEGECHPRAAGTFPRFLARYVRELGALSLVEALHKITLAPAERAGFDDRKGSLEPGKDADIVIFDADTITDGSTFDNPTVPPVGIDRVIVAGRTVVASGADTDALPGTVITRGAGC